MGSVLHSPRLGWTAELHPHGLPAALVLALVYCITTISQLYLKLSLLPLQNVVENNAFRELNELMMHALQTLLFLLACEDTARASMPKGCVLFLYYQEEIQNCMLEMP